MAYDPELAERIRTVSARTPGVQERKMFGGLAFLLGGNVAASAYKDGGMMIRCSKETWEEYLAEAGTRPMLRKGKPVSGWVQIDAEAVRDEKSLKRWVRRGLEFAGAQPPK
jgi:TfoX/Sxy family transcriptional regulator of competence genes